MAMFSMKPKFDLAKFLAEPARPGTRNKPRQFRRTPKAAQDEESNGSETEE